VFAVISVLAVAAIVLLVRTAPPPLRGPRRPATGRRSALGGDSAAYLDSLDEAAEQRVLRESMSLAEVAARAKIPADSLAAELRLPITASLTFPLRAILLENHLTLKDVRDARRRVEVRLGAAAGRR